ncbi:MAG: hypothetical protein ACKO3W_12575 [bacterium]
MDRLNATIALVLVANLSACLATISGCAPRDEANPTRLERSASSLGPIDVADGRSVAPFDGAANSLVAIVFISHECPIANAMAPDLRALSAHAKSNGVEFHLVHPSPWASRDELLRHAREFGYVSDSETSTSVLADPSQSLVARSGATITPEGALFRLDGKGGGELLYLGRVNDLYVGIGRRRPSISSHDLSNAIDAALAGRAIAQPFPKAVGCFIESPR